jgi:hypothetical protein
MEGHATISMVNIPGDPFYIGSELVAITHSGNMVLDFVTPVDAFGAYMRVEFAYDYDYIGVRFFDSDGNNVGGFQVSTPLPGLWWYGYVSSVPFQSIIFGYSEAHWFIMDDLQAGRPIPEPSTWLLLASGLIGFAGYGRKKLFKK